MLYSQKLYKFGNTLVKGTNSHYKLTYWLFISVYEAHILHEHILYP